MHVGLAHLTPDTNVRRSVASRFGCGNKALGPFEGGQRLPLADFAPQIGRESDRSRQDRVSDRRLRPDRRRMECVSGTNIEQVETGRAARLWPEKRTGTGGLSKVGLARRGSPRMAP
jgi:hypothetical protein